MPLKGVKPEAHKRRLKLLMFGEAGVGKTTAACQMPSPYIIDAERGTENYSELINNSNGSVFHTTDIGEVMDEIRVLSTEPHPFKSLIIDPFTSLYNDVVEKMEEIHGNEWGKHYSEANKYMKKMVNLLMRLDMNVVVTAHAKPKYGDDMKIVGETFDGWKRLPYIFDLVLQLKKTTPTKRFAKVEKTRIAGFPDGESFEWNYDELIQRYDLEELERSAETIVLISVEQLENINQLKETMKDAIPRIDKYLKKAGVDEVSDLSFDQAAKMIKAMKKTIGVST